jgi:hypothetical protein
LDANHITPAEIVPASRKLGRADAAAIIKAATRVIVAKGKKLDEFPGGKPNPAAIDAMLGPTGNLRAPTMRVGGTVLVGFDEATFRSILR